MKSHRTTKQTHLREHQEATFGMYRPDGSRIGEEVQHAQPKPLRKYVSVFRIDGKPIIPPLMTSEKRRQMQMLREKAIQIEQRLTERRKSISTANSQISGEKLSETSRSSFCNTAGSVSQRSQDYYEAKLKESEESMILLEDIIRRQSGGQEEMHGNHTTGCNSHVHHSPRSHEYKLKKLQKSETLIYDNSTNEVIKQIQCDEESKPLRADHTLTLRELERKANLNYLQPRKPSHLLLAGINDKGGVSIPSICLNPPTPLVANRQICDASSATESNDSLLASEAEQQCHYLPADLSSDDSFTSMLTHSDVRPTQVTNRKNGMPRSGKIHDLKAYNSPTNVTAKIQQFEAISSNHSSPTTTPQSSPDKTVLSRSKLGTPSTTISRSATSPSIKLNTFQPRPQTTPENSQNTTDNNLIRSSSFTLEAPSKALIDHMRQQRTSKKSSCNIEVIKVIPPLASPQIFTRKISSPSRVHRDTIESKAKRVQKVELKPSRQKTQQKTSQHKLAHAAAASMSSPHPTSFPSHTSTGNLYKTKKSPYDAANSTRSIGHLHKSSATAAKKSPTSSASSVTSQKLNKLKSPPTAASPKPMNAEKEALTQMDKIQKDKFMRLLKQQEEEQNKLKQAFEMQQKLLIEQLNKEMAATQLISPIQIPTSKPEPTPATQQNEILNMDLLGTATDLTQHRQIVDGEPSPQTSPALSNNMSLQSETSITPNSCDYVPPVPSLPISSFSSMDHSNTNTSLESSSNAVSNQSSQRTLTPHGANTTTPEENGHVTVDFGVHVSSSRRRLFSQDVVASSSCGPTHNISMNTLCARSPSNHRMSETQPHQVIATANKGHGELPNRRTLDENVANAAATKINAYTRGFLVRRLFQTEQIQRIVQTIRDTLIFVLNLHLETCEHREANTAANIKLKARLLQQLSSATRTLHLVLFQTSIKERMDIIARDRKRIKTKLLAMNRKRTPRIAG